MFDLMPNLKVLNGRDKDGNEAEDPTGARAADVRCCKEKVAAHTMLQECGLLHELYSAWSYTRADS